IITLILIVKSSFGQQFTDFYGDYIGQTPPGDTPVVFAPGIISKNTLEHSAAIFSPDGNEVYWVSRENQESRLKIWRMLKIDNRWTKPAIFNPLGDSINHFDPFTFLTANDEKVYFGADNNGNTDIWFVEKKGKHWNKPQRLKSSINTLDGQCQASLTTDGTLYYLDHRTINDSWTCDILKSRFKNGEYLRPDTLPERINSVTSMDWTPFIAPDDSYLLFSSQRGQNYGDLYISFHDIHNDNWSEPINLGEPINTGSQESFPTVSPDGKYLFFTRWTNEENDMDIYWVSTRFINKLREKV
ncbi:MAG: hypothetical protein WCW62_16660, partial [Bacteroidales bacterium]